MQNHSLSVTVDLEDWYHVPSLIDPAISGNVSVEQFLSKWDRRYDYLTAPTHRVLDLLDEFNVRATFFIVADILLNYQGLAEAIAERGHEIACHGLHHYCKLHPNTKRPTVSAAEFRLMTLEAKRALEDACHVQVVGYRAPNAYVAGWMLDALEEMKFKYDSSVSANSLYN
ncbi:MAG: polysaccharide deacetylase family protein, partial [Candidatus Bathyarchaeia archaeon]